MTVHQPLPPGKYRVRVEDYLRLDEAGAFGDARTELIEGEIWVMSPAFTRHAKTQSRLDFALRSALMNSGSSLEVFTAPSLKIAEDTMPEPDLVVGEDHDEGPLPAGKVRLTVEIADTTVDYDLDRKVPLYARTGIAEYWVVDVNARMIHQMWHPDGDTYVERRDVAFGEPITAATLDGLTVETAAL